MSRLKARAADSDVSVLIVDDHQDTRDIYSSYLRHLGVRVRTAVNGLDGVEQSERWRPSVIVMDVSMPVLGGEQAICLIKADPRIRSIPIIAMTAHGLLARSKAIAAGCDAFCQKPCTPDELASVIEQLLDADDD